MSKKTKLDKRIDAGLEMMLKHILKGPKAIVDNPQTLAKPHISTEAKTALIASVSARNSVDPFFRYCQSKLRSWFASSKMFSHNMLDFWSATDLVGININWPTTDRVSAELDDRHSYLRSALLVFRLDYGDTDRLDYIISLLPSIKSPDIRKTIIGYKANTGRVPLDPGLQLWEAARVFLDPSRMGTEQPPPN